MKIKNKGLDIPKEKLDTIFEKFYRLAIAKDIVDLHKGKIWAKCRGGEIVISVLFPKEE